MGCCDSKKTILYNISNNPHCCCAHTHLAHMHSQNYLCSYANDYQDTESYSEKVVDYYNESWHTETVATQFSTNSITETITGSGGNWIGFDENVISIPTAYETKWVCNKTPIYKTVYRTRKKK